MPVVPRRVVAHGNEVDDESMGKRNGRDRASISTRFVKLVRRDLTAVGTDDLPYRRDVTAMTGLCDEYDEVDRCGRELVGRLKREPLGRLHRVQGELVERGARGVG